LAVRSKIIAENMFFSGKDSVGEGFTKGWWWWKGSGVFHGPIVWWEV
jgi:hypothetical protein